MDLGSLFSPSYRSHEFSFNSLSGECSIIALLASPSASTDFDRTGELIWPVSVLLAQCCLNLKSLSLLITTIDHPTFVELGAGMGLPSCALLQQHSNLSVIATDGADYSADESSPLTMNLSQYGDRACGKKLLWGCVEDVLACSEKNIDVVIAADVCQWPSVIEPLALTIHALLWRSEEARIGKNFPPFFFLGIVERDDGSLKQTFFSKLKSLGFTIREIPNDEFLRKSASGDYMFPKSGAEFGGRVCKIYEMELVNFAIQPSLLSVDGLDCIQGSGFAQTLTMPC